VVHQAVRDGFRDCLQSREQPVAPGLHHGVQVCLAAREPDDSGDLSEVDQLGGSQVHQGADGLFDIFGGSVGRGVVADDDVASGAAAHGELIKLEGEEAAVFAQFQDVLGDFLGDAADHFLALEGDGHIANRHHRLDLQSGQ
jgi:hypothetical protein